MFTRGLGQEQCSICSGERVNSKQYDVMTNEIDEKGTPMKKYRGTEVRLDDVMNKEEQRLD